MQPADLPGDGVHLATDRIPLLGEATLPGIQLDDTIQAGGVLAAPGDAGLHGVGIGTEQPDVDHDPEPSVAVGPLLDQFSLGDPALEVQVPTICRPHDLTVPVVDP